MYGCSESWNRAQRPAPRVGPGRGPAVHAAQHPVGPAQDVHPLDTAPWHGVGRIRLQRGSSAAPAPMDFSRLRREKRRSRFIISSLGLLRLSGGGPSESHDGSWAGGGAAPSATPSCACEKGRHGPNVVHRFSGWRAYERRSVRKVAAGAASLDFSPGRDDKGAGVKPGGHRAGASTLRARAWSGFCPGAPPRCDVLRRARGTRRELRSNVFQRRERSDGARRSRVGGRVSAGSRPGHRRTVPTVRGGQRGRVEPDGRLGQARALNGGQGLANSGGPGYEPGWDGTPARSRRPRPTG